MTQNDSDILVTQVDIEPIPHLGDLNPDQRKAFTVFKTNLTKAGLYTPSKPTIDGDEPSKPNHDDITLLCVLVSYGCKISKELKLLSTRRFLRARRFDPTQAQKQFANAEEWRAKHQVDDLFTSFPVVEFEAAKRFYPRWTGRRDKVSYVEVACCYDLSSWSDPSEWAPSIRLSASLT